MEYGGISPELAIEQSMMGAIKGKPGFRIDLWLQVHWAQPLDLAT